MPWKLDGKSLVAFNLDAGQPEVVQRGSPWYEKFSFSYPYSGFTLLLYIVANSFIPRRECAHKLPRGAIEYFFHFNAIGNGYRGFKNTNVNRPL